MATSIAWRSRPHRPVGAPLPRRQHPGELLPDAGSSEPAAGRPGSTPQEGRAVIVNQNGNGDGRPLRITGSSPPDSWRSLRQPGYPQLNRVRQPKHRAYRPDHTPEVSNFQSQKMGSFQSQLTEPPSAVRRVDHRTGIKGGEVSWIRVRGRGNTCLRICTTGTFVQAPAGQCRQKVVSRQYARIVGGSCGMWAKSLANNGLSKHMKQAYLQ